MRSAPFIDRFRDLEEQAFDAERETVGRLLDPLFAEQEERVPGWEQALDQVTKLLSQCVAKLFSGHQALADQCAPEPSAGAALASEDRFEEAEIDRALADQDLRESRTRRGVVATPLYEVAAPEVQSDELRIQGDA